MAIARAEGDTLTALRRQLGGEPAPGALLRVAVVTPYYREPDDILEACLASVRAQTHPATHILVADGHRSPLVDARPAHPTHPVQHIVLPQAHGDFGSTPRAIGSLSAVAQGFDAIAYLDADNWYEPDHVQSMVDLHRQSGAVVCVASRALHRLDGSLLDAAGEASDGKTHVDTNCLFLTSAAFRAASLWGLVPSALRAIDDRLVWTAIRGLGVRIARRLPPTVHYRTAFAVHYAERGEPPPTGAKTHDHVGRALTLWRNLSSADRDLVGRRMGIQF